MKKDSAKIFGYLEYQLCLTGGDPVMAIPVPVSSKEEADKMRKIKIKQNTKTISHSGFRVLSPDKRKVLHDYEGTQELTLPTGKKPQRTVVRGEKNRKQRPSI
ncbi:hypothetical protein [Chitinophaga arvensicola]|uniref:Uncharacterized protein n=1 Tax=Chitinophaga arvensicola TaxID=29529 RepID=A0A1I0PL94_9BACT|nr:hypothetical protein [Chitinophaga arvensicola]SEW15180.1 hypothetical protein SAMN04488122_0850 [Chitinophaga arvensicola]